MSRGQQLRNSLRDLQLQRAELKRRISQSMTRTSSYATTQHCRQLQRELDFVNRRIAQVKNELRTLTWSSAPRIHPGPRPQIIEKNSSPTWLIVIAVLLVGVLITITLNKGG